MRITVSLKVWALGLMVATGGAWAGPAVKARPSAFDLRERD
jgi:hypothetical protein